MGVAPYFAYFSAIYISVGDVHASDIAYLSIYDCNLSVVAPIDAIGKLREGNAEERMDINSGFR